MRIEIICTGDEVLTGKITNTNFSYMAQKLEDVGLSVHWGTTVGDDRDSLLAAFQLAAARADAVIVNGGLGPTVDDLSQEVAAQAAGVELVLHEEWLARMESFFSRRMRTMPPNNVKQAMLPATAEMIDNPIGTACGFALDIGTARFFFTPGVPRELHRMLGAAGHPPHPRPDRRTGLDPPEAVSFVWSGRIPCGPTSHRRRGTGPGRRREARFSRTLSAVGNQADSPRQRHG